MEIEGKNDAEYAPKKETTRRGKTPESVALGVKGSLDYVVRSTFSNGTDQITRKQAPVVHHAEPVSNHFKHLQPLQPSNLFWVSVD